MEEESKVEMKKFLLVELYKTMRMFNGANQLLLANEWHIRTIHLRSEDTIKIAEE